MSSSPLSPSPSFLLLLLALPSAFASVTMCGQEYESTGCGRLNNVQFGFTVAIPLLLPALVFYAVRYKDFSLPGHPSSMVNNIAVSMSLSDRNVNFRRRSIPSANPPPGSVEMSLYSPAPTTSDFTLTLHHSGTRRVLHCDSLPPHSGTLLSLSLPSTSPVPAVFRPTSSSSSSTTWELITSTGPTSLYLSCFGGSPSEGALLCLREEAEACPLTFSTAPGDTLGAVMCEGGFIVKCDEGGSGSVKLFAQVGKVEEGGEVFKFKREEVEE
ncbi:hypothetical protein TrVE_jg11176 [Triparma verrucosa]|uniref:Uncharacterized protein n=1 Tax=Triparma verrucosa TaxID=1606542 RepID=A0A9W7B590_9STRA|nr:hypothetical protein TrVE_jg11176 [Triparma verrucosa]